MSIDERSKAAIIKSMGVIRDLRAKVAALEESLESERVAHAATRALLEQSRAAGAKRGRATQPRSDAERQRPTKKMKSGTSTKDKKAPSAYVSSFLGVKDFAFEPSDESGGEESDAAPARSVLPIPMTVPAGKPVAKPTPTAQFQPKPASKSATNPSPKNFETSKEVLSESDEASSDDSLDLAVDVEVIPPERAVAVREVSSEDDRGPPKASEARARAGLVTPPVRFEALKPSAAGAAAKADTGARDKGEAKGCKDRGLNDEDVVDDARDDAHDNDDDDGNDGDDDEDDEAFYNRAVGGGGDDDAEVDAEAEGKAEGNFEGSVKPDVEQGAACGASGAACAPLSRAPLSGEQCAQRLRWAEGRALRRIQKCSVEAAAAAKEKGTDSARLRAARAAREV